MARTYALNVGSAPPVGHVHRWADTDYTVIASRQVMLRTGANIALTWRFDCCDCGEPVDILSSGKLRTFPFRCKPCNGPEDKDTLERAAYVTAGRSERAKARNAKGAEILDAVIDGSLSVTDFEEEPAEENVRITCTAIDDFDTVNGYVRAWATYDDDQRIRFAYKAGKVVMVSRTAKYRTAALLTAFKAELDAAAELFA